MKVLVACEESQRVCIAFRERGHEAYSCDLQECSGGHPEWHILGDCLPIIGGGVEFVTMDGEKHRIDGKWDLIIAHPPCTDLAISGAAWFEKKRADGRQRESIELFCKFLTADCDRIVIENPIGIISGNYIAKWFPDLADKYGLPIKPTQIIQPWMFGDNFSKQTCLWEIGVAPLKPIVTVQPELEYHEWIDGKTGRIKRQPKWYYEAFVNSKTPEERAKARSKTFEGIANAMAEQWGGVSDEQIKAFGENLKNAYLGSICPIDLDSFGQDLAAEIRKEIDAYIARKEGKDGDGETVLLD